MTGLARIRYVGRRARVTRHGACHGTRSCGAACNCLLYISSQLLNLACCMLRSRGVCCMVCAACCAMQVGLCALHAACRASPVARLHGCSTSPQCSRAPLGAALPVFRNSIRLEELGVRDVVRRPSAVSPRGHTQPPPISGTSWDSPSAGRRHIHPRESKRLAPPHSSRCMRRPLASTTEFSMVYVNIFDFADSCARSDGKRREKTGIKDRWRMGDARGPSATT